MAPDSDAPGTRPEPYGPATYGDRVAAVYDDDYGWNTTDLDATVELLGGLAGPGPALELGVGTGRVALPLRARGVDVRGLDASEAMVERLRAKPGGADVPVTVADMAGPLPPGPHSLVYVVWNTFFAILDQEQQVGCFANVAATLAPGGTFVVEAFVPHPGLFADNQQRVMATAVEVDSLRLGASHHFRNDQRVESVHVEIREDGIRLYPVHVRYAWPSELDLMARLAGLRLRDRWGGWRGERFDDSSTRHVSVWERPPA